MARHRSLSVVVASLVVTGVAGAPTGSVAAVPKPAGFTVDADQPIDDPELRVALAEARSPSATSRASSVPLLSVELLHDGDEAVASAAVSAVGGTVSGTAVGKVVEALVPADRVVELAKMRGVGYLRKTRMPNLRIRQQKPLAGILETAAVTITKADAWHAAGVTGAGVKIGIIDYFSGSWSELEGYGDAPTPAGVFCRKSGVACDSQIFDPNEDGHGNAVGEVIHDMAPGAALYLATADTVSDTVAAVKWFRSQGVTIISRSLGNTYDGPGNGTGLFEDVAALATSYGMLWLNAAGNEGQQAYWRGPWRDANGNGYLEFNAGGDERLRIDGWYDGTGYGVQFGGGRWSDWGLPGSRTDYDFELWDAGGKVYPPGSTRGPNQTAGASPIEMDGVGGHIPSGTSVDVRVRKRTPGTATTIGDTLELMTWAGTPEYWQTPYSAANPIVDSANPAVLAVGAVDPANGPAIAPYSSQGPTNDGRIKPDLSAPSCFFTNTYGPNCFNGTSAATPVVAGAAALFKQRGLAANGVGLGALLRRYVVDRGTPGRDNAFGSGQLVMPAVPPANAVNTAASAYTAITPIRLMDSRKSALSPRGTAGRYLPNTITNIPVRGQPIPGSNPPVIPVPATATAVAINVTVVNPVTGGYSQVLPFMAAPAAGFATLNVAAGGQTQPNFTIVPLGVGGRLSIFTTSGGNFVIDILGYFTPSATVAAGRLMPLNPVRVLDTRASAATKPALLPSGWVNHTPVSGEVVTYDFKAAGPLPPTGVSAVVMHVTAASATSAGYVTAYPAGRRAPVAAMLNLLPGQSMTNLVIVPLGTNRSISLRTTAGGHLIGDLVGYMTDATTAPSTAGLFVPIKPARRFDSRRSDADFSAQKFAAGEARSYQIYDHPPIGRPNTGVAAISFNVTAVRQESAGWLVTWPDGRTPRSTDVIWPAPNYVLAAGSITKLSPGGRMSVLTSAVSDVVVDINGYFTAS